MAACSLFSVAFADALIAIVVSASVNNIFFMITWFKRFVFAKLILFSETTLHKKQNFWENLVGLQEIS
jgi:hypothetical protein